MPRPATGAFSHIEACADVAGRLERRCFEHVELEQKTGEAAPTSPLYQGPPSILADHQQADQLESALVMLIITDGCGLDWDPAKGPTLQVLLQNLPSARAEAAYVFEAVLAGVTAGIMQPCACIDLTCVLPLGVAFS